MVKKWKLTFSTTKICLPLTFLEYLCQLPIDLSTVTIRQWSTDWTPGLPKPLILMVLGVQTPRLPRLPISHILRVLGVLESRLPRLPIASTFWGFWESRESGLRDSQYSQNLGYWESRESGSPGPWTVLRPWRLFTLSRSYNQHLRDFMAANIEFP